MLPRSGASKFGQPKLARMLWRSRRCHTVVFNCQKSSPVVPLEKRLYAAIAGLPEEVHILLGSERLKNSTNTICLLENLLGRKALASLEIPVKLCPDIL